MVSVPFEGYRYDEEGFRTTTGLRQKADRRQVTDALNEEVVNSPRAPDGRPPSWSGPLSTPGPPRSIPSMTRLPGPRMMGPTPWTRRKCSTTFRTVGCARLNWGHSARAAVPRYPQALCPTSKSPQAGREPSTGAERRRCIAATSLGVAVRTEGHANAFSKQANCFSSPSARGTCNFLDRRKPPRKCRLKECSPAETWYTLT